MGAGYLACPDYFLYTHLTSLLVGSVLREVEYKTVSCGDDGIRKARIFSW